MTMMITSTETNFGISDLKKDNTCFTLKSCSCAEKAWVCIVANTMKLRYNVGVSKAL